MITPDHDNSVANIADPRRPAPASSVMHAYTAGKVEQSPGPVLPDKAGFVNAMADAVNGVSVVTTDGPAGRFGITVSSVSSVSADPPLVLACINRRSPVCTAVRENGRFCVNLLSTRQRNVADMFAGSPVEGDPFDFDDVASLDGVTGAPCFSGAITAAKRRGAELAPVVGEMMNVLNVAQVTLGDMIRINDNHGFDPSLEITNAISTRKAIAADAIKNVVELAAELVGGPGFFRGHAMERIVRDTRAMHFHPLPVRRQQLFSRRIALGFDPVERV